MSFAIQNSYRRRGRRRSPLLNLVALEYILWPERRPNGLQKALAHANGIAPTTLSAAVVTIKERARR